MTRNASRNTKRKQQKSSTELLEFVQDFIPVRSIHHGIIETTDNRYIKILEIEPINFMLRSEEEQFNIISSFASWLKISPQHLQFKSITRKADSDRHVRLLRQDLEGETKEECRRQAEGYIRFVRDVGNREALTRRFFLIYQYEEQRRGDSENFGLVYSTIQTVEQNARAYFMQCGNTIVQHKDPDQATAEILYMFFNRRSCVEEPFESRVNRVVVDSMAARNLVIGADDLLLPADPGYEQRRGADARRGADPHLPELYWLLAAGLKSLPADARSISPTRHKAARMWTSLGPTPHGPNLAGR